MGSGLDSPTRLSPDKDPVFAGLHQKLFNSAQNDPLRLADAPTDLIPGQPGTDVKSQPGIRVADNSGPPPITATDARPAPQRTASDTPPPVLPNADTRVASGTPAPVDSTVTAAPPADATPAPGSSTFTYNDKGSSADDPTICNWRPNPNSTSQLTKDWFAAHQANSSAPVDCNYTVKFGDDLGSIARRELKTENKATDSASIKAEVAKIIQLNHDHYKSLDCNTEFIRAGWTLKLNDACTTGAAPVEAPPAPVEAPPPAPAPIDHSHVTPTERPVGAHPKDNCGPCGADVVVDNPRGRTYLNGAEVGDHDRSIITGRQAKEVPIPSGDAPPHLRQHRSDVPITAAPVVGDNAPATPPPVVADTRVPADVPLPGTPAPEVTTPPPVIATRQASVEGTPPAVSGDPTSNDDLIPGQPAEVAQPVAANPAPVVARVATAPAPAGKIAAPSGNGNDLGDGANLGPG